MRRTLYGVAALFTLTSVLAADTPESVPSFRIEPGDAVKAEIRVYSAALTQLYLVLTAEKVPSYISFVRKHAGQKTRIYVCGELLGESTMADPYATPECSFFVAPQQGLDLALKLVTKPGSKRPKGQ